MVAQRTQQKLESLPKEQRKEFINKKSHVWRAFRKALSKMSYGKCWYSETPDPGAKFDIDHFRPKSEAKRTDDITDEEGYAWLAFDWENFRLSAQRCNRLNKDENTDETLGKGSWFPLLEGSPKADWDNRCENAEQPLLLDPVNKSDLNWIDITEKGYFQPLPHCVGINTLRIQETAKIYGLNLPSITEARLEVMREVKNIYEIIMKTAESLEPLGEKASEEPIEMQIELLKGKTRADAKFSFAARSQLKRLAFGDDFIDRSLDAA
jgi:hypothetical protein